MATLCSLFQQPGTALLIGLLLVLDPWIWHLAAVVLELLPPFPSHLQPTVCYVWSAYTGTKGQRGRTSMLWPHVSRPTRPPSSTS